MAKEGIIFSTRCSPNRDFLTCQQLDRIDKARLPEIFLQRSGLHL